MARRLIERSGIPLAAPSANRSERLSPTTAHHVLESLGNRIDLILDGGPCDCGIESTVIDCTTSPPRILRPGPLDKTAIEAVAGAVAVADRASDAEPARSPGQRERHYCPKTPMEVPLDAPARVAALIAQGSRVGWLVLGSGESARSIASSKDLVAVPMPHDPAAYARHLYATLHALDQRQLDRIVADRPPDDDAWRAVRDRLGRAALVE